MIYGIWLYGIYGYFECDRNLCKEFVPRCPAYSYQVWQGMSGQSRIRARMKCIHTTDNQRDGHTSFVFKIFFKQNINGY